MAVDYRERLQRVRAAIHADLPRDWSLDDLADVAGTIGYEILTSLGARYTRRYQEGGA